MRLLFIRFYQYTGFHGLLVMILGSAGFVLILVSLRLKGRVDASVGSIVPIAFGILIGAIAMVNVVVATRNYRRSSATFGYDEILPLLERSEREYCLVLRPFGRDGEVILPVDIPARKAVPNAGLSEDNPTTRTEHARGTTVRTAPIPNRDAKTFFTPNTTMEQVVVTAARAALGLETYGLVNQKVLFAPPGLTYMRASDDDWKCVAQRLIRRAHSIVLILPPGRETGAGFTWEVEQIVHYGKASRVVIVLPPCDQDVRARPEALLAANLLLLLLERSGTRADLGRSEAGDDDHALPANTLVVRYTQKSGPRSWNALPAGPSEKARGKKRQKPVVGHSIYL